MLFFKYESPLSGVPPKNWILFDLDTVKAIQAIAMK